MPYRDYQAPGVNVIIERNQQTSTRALTDFMPVFIGTGMTSRNRVVSMDGIRADVSEFPVVQFEWDVTNNFNTQVFRSTDFSISKLELQKEVEIGVPVTPLTEGVDYEVVEVASLMSVQGKVRTTINILNVDDVTNTDLIYNLDVTLENTDDDFDLLSVTSDDRYYTKDIFGPIKLVENGNEFLNDIAVAAEIAFRMNVPRFFYMEVPREYGSEATKEDIIKALDKVYYKKDAYRVVPLTSDADVAQTLSAFTTSLSNPIDRREVVGFSSYDTDLITDVKDLDELIEKVGGFSESLDNERIVNIFGGTSVEMVIGTTRYVLPMYFMNAAIASLDTTVGMAEPLSSRELNVFAKLNGPRFRPRQWDQLARMGVFIVYQNEENGPITIRHQLTTKQSEAAEFQEYSMVKNFDAVTKRLRDRMSPYAGSMNITEGYRERIDATFTSAVEEVKQLGWASDIVTLSPWTLRTVGTGDTLTENKRNLVSRHQLIPAYPANNLDVYLII